MAGPRPIFDPDRMKGGAATPALPKTLTPSQLNAFVKRVLGDHLPGTIHLVGEISNLARPASGHVYLTLKDERSEVRCVMWRSAAQTLKFQLNDGQEVIATGFVDVYEPRGQLQFYAQKIEPRGVGSLELAFRQLRDRLAKEGLFEPGHKKPIPRFPRRLAIVTSATGAALHDILQTLRRRYPCVDVLIDSVRVQGEGAAKEIAAAVNRLNRHSKALGKIDLLIVGRGGGSLEDLWAFNEEVVARAIYASGIPVISAVGHEVDVTIADLVADLRAPTPTAAAELAVPVLSEVLETLNTAASRLRRATGNLVDRQSARLQAAAASPWLRDPLALVRQQAQRLDETAARLQLVGAQILASRKHRLHDLQLRLAGVQPRALAHRRQRQVEDLAARLRWQTVRLLDAARQKLHADEIRLHDRHPRSLLGRHQERQREIAARLHRAMQGLMRTASHALRQHDHAFLAVSSRRRVAIEGGKVEQLERQLQRTVLHRLALAGPRLEALESRIEATSHHKTLARGFSLTRDAATGRIIVAADQVAPGQQVVTQTAEGDFTSKVIAPD